MDQIAKGFEKHVGTLIRYSCVVDKIKQGPKGVVVTYTDKFGEQDTITADYCVCTIPLSVLKNIDADFSKPFKAAMSGVAYAPVNKIGLQMKTRFWEENHHIYGGHIYNDMDIDEQIPAEHFEAVAKVIGFVMSNKQAKKRAWAD